MGIINRVSDWYWSKPAGDFATRGQGSQDSFGGNSPLPGIIPPSRSSDVAGDLNSAMTLDSVYRAMTIITNNVMQLDLKAYKSGKVANNALVRKPNVDQTRSKFIKRTVIGLAGTGNAYWLITRDEFGVVTNLDVLNPQAVFIHYDNNGNKLYGYGNQDYRADQVKHLRLLEVPGSVLGAGPIQICSRGITSALDVAYYGDNFYRDSGVPTGVLSTTEHLTDEESQRYGQQWIAARRTNSTAILGAGYTYQAIMLNPADAQWLESQQFSVQKIARMFGIPATWLLAEVGGNSMTYSNQEQVWIEYIRNTLMGYLVEIEDAFTELTPNGITVKFDLNGLLRPDSKTRSEINASDITAGIRTINEVRESEGLQPLTPKQLEALKPVAAPVQETPNDE